MITKHWARQNIVRKECVNGWTIKLIWTALTRAHLLVIFESWVALNWSCCSLCWRWGGERVGLVSSLRRCFQLRPSRLTRSCYDQPNCVHQSPHRWRSDTLPTWSRRTRALCLFAKRASFHFWNYSSEMPLKHPCSPPRANRRWRRPSSGKNRSWAPISYMANIHCSSTSRGRKGRRGQIWWRMCSVLYAGCSLLCHLVLQAFLDLPIA